MVSQREIKQNEKEAHDVARLRAPVVYTAIKQEGEDELSRPFLSLWWSGLAAGLAIYLSVFATGALHHYLGDAGAASVFVHFGYCLGFLVVVLGRLQLFTENTITAVVPVLYNRDIKTLLATLRLWSIVLIANLIGVFIAAWATVNTGIFPPDVMDGMLEISRHYIHRDAMAFFTQGVPAGFIVAALVWMLPSSRGLEYWVIIALTFMISLGGLTHVIAGSGEVFLMVLQQEMSVGDAFTVSILPTLAGNVLGGTVLFALLAYGQVMEEI